MRDAIAGVLIGLIAVLVMFVVLLMALHIAMWNGSWYSDVGCRLAALERQAPMPEHCPAEEER